MGNQPVKVDPKGKQPNLILKNKIEQMRENKRLLDRAARKIERERGKIEEQEKKHIREI